MKCCATRPSPRDVAREALPRATRSAAHAAVSNATAHGVVHAGAAPGDDLALDGEFLRKLERLDLVARKVYRGLLRGEHATARRGRGLDFSDFRRYRPGDDIRHIDWNIYSRLDRLFLKLYAAEEDVSLHVVLDVSASMGFGAPAKFNHARRIAAALAYVGLSNLDRVRLAAFAAHLQAGTPALKGRSQMAAVLGFLRGLRCGGATDAVASLRELTSRSRHPGLVVLVSDFLDGADAQSGIEALRGHGHEVVALQLLAEDEIEPPLAGALRLVDAESGAQMVVTVDAELRELYRRRLAQRLDEMERYCRRRGVEYLRASTAIPFEDVVLRYLRDGALLR